MKPIHFQANFLPKVRKFKVEVTTPERRWVELMSVARFMRFAKSSDKPMQIGGITLKIDNAEVLNRIWDYFKQIAAAYRKQFCMSETFGMPGPGGSLGKCALCGKPFLAEILLGQTVKSFSVDGCNMQLFGHEECLKLFGDRRVDVAELPVESPLREAWEAAKAKGEI